MNDIDDIISVWKATNKNILHELTLLWDQFKNDIAFVRKDYDFVDLKRELLPGCRPSCKWFGKCRHQELFEKYRERHREILCEKFRKKLCENIWENFRELRAISYHWGGTSVSRRNRIESEIVLLDTRSEMNAIHCISIPFDENVPAYYAISYRWGVHPEWKAQTPNYVASITSISQGNLIKLCRYYRDRIRYMWIDVICINQSDRAHRKMAIKNMSDIYGRARRIIGVPDLRYCEDNLFMEDVTREDIEAAIIGMSENLLYPWDTENIEMLLHKHEPGTYYEFRLDISDLPKKMKPWNESTGYRDLDDYTRTKQQVGDIEKGVMFITQVILEWANRVWVVSERVIGNEGNKLLIHILRTNTVFWHGILFGVILDVIWEFDDAEGAFNVMLDCDSDKYIDRLYAILPHTGYDYAMEKVIDKDITVNDKDDLKWILFDILNTYDKRRFLQFLVLERDEFSMILPLSVREKDSDEDSYNKSPLRSCKRNLYGDYFEIETITENGNRVLKISCPFIYPYQQPDNDEESQPSDAGDVSDMVLLCARWDKYLCWQYRRSEDEEVWKFLEVTELTELTKPESPWRWKYGEFLLFQSTQDGFLEAFYT